MEGKPADLLLESTGKRILFVASTGGHLAQLKRISASLDAAPGSTWVTFDSPQSRSLLAEEDVLFVPYVSPRDWRTTVRVARLVSRQFRGRKFDLAISTGAALAVAVLPGQRLRGVPAVYIESISRTDGPSLSGKILAATRIVALRTQHPLWATRRWRPFPPVLSSFRSIQRAETVPASLKVFVTLGTIRPYRFDSVVDALVRSGAVGSTTVWQLGETERSDLPGEVHTYMSDESFRAACESADVVLTHSGVGTILALLEMGIYPVVVPRRSRRNEHVDDHQEQIATLVESLGIAESVEADGDVARAITRAASRKIIDG